MEMHYKLLVLLSVSCLCDGHLQRLGGFLTEAHQRIHSNVHDVAGAVIGGFNSFVGGHSGRWGHARHPGPPSDGGTVLVIVEESTQDDGRQPEPPYHHHHHHYPPPPPPPPNYNGFNPHRPYPNSHPGQNQFQNNPYNNQGNNGNNYAHNGNGVPNQDAYGNPNYPSHNADNGNGFTNPEQNKPNLDGNYKPSETYNDQQHNDAHKAENTDVEKNDKTGKKPTSDGPLLVPLNDYTYGGEKIAVNAPKREADKAEEAEDEEFPIDIRFKDE